MCLSKVKKNQVQSSIKCNEVLSAIKCQVQLSVKCNWVGIGYLISLLHTSLTSLNIGSALLSWFICQYHKLSQSISLISLDIKYVLSSKFAYQHHSRYIIRQDYRPSKRNSTRSSFLLLGLLLAGLKPDMLIRQGLYSSSTPLLFER